MKGLYVGSDFYAPGDSTQTAARISGFNRLFLSSLHIDSEGNITYNDTPVVQDGVYVGDPAWGTKLAALKTKPSDIQRLELVIGGSGDNTSFANIRKLVVAQGTDSQSILYRDFLALKIATGVDAIQLADEITYDVRSTVAFSRMILELGLKVSLRPCANPTFWADVKSQLSTNVDAIYLQCYASGANNDPAVWNQIFGDLKVYPGLWGNTDTPASAMMKMRNWQETLGITGGFMWLNGFMPGDALKWSGALSYGLDSLSCIRIVNKNSGKSLNLLGGGKTNGSAIRQSRYPAGNNLKWMWVPTETGEHLKLVSWVSGQCASIAFSSSLSSAQLWTWDYNSDPSQQFDLIDAGNGWFKIRNVRSGLVLEVAGGSMDDEAAVQQNIDTGAANQQWRFYPYGDTLLAYEYFDYPIGNLSGQNGGEGWNGGWSDVLGLGTKVLEGSLIGGDNVPTKFDARSSGNSAFIPNDKRAGRYLDCSINGIFGAYGYLDSNGRIGAAGTSLYLSFLQRPNKTSLFYEFELNRGVERIAGIGNDTRTNNVNLRAPAGIFTSLGPGNTNVNFYVMRIDFKPGKDDIRVYRNSTSEVEPAQPTLTISNAADLSFNRICLAAFANDNTVQFDQLRIATSWENAVASAPEFAISPSSKVVSSDVFRQIRISAIVLHGKGQTYYLLDGETGVRVLLNRPANLLPGDVVEVTGLIEGRDQFVNLIEANVSQRGHSSIPQPRPLDLQNVENAFPWVSVEGTLLKVRDEGIQRSLEMQHGAKRFTARLQSEQLPKVDWPPGSRLKITGVHLRSVETPDAPENKRAFEILLNAWSDVEILARPPWWTLKRALIIVGLLMFALALTFIWISLLRRQVERRTVQWKQEISKREKSEQERIIMEERTRISRDLHDDFGSKLTQISLLAWLPEEASQIDKVRERLRVIGEKSRHMVSALDEVVWMMNPRSETLSSFTAYIAGYADEFLSRTDIACRIESPAFYPEKIITSEARNHLFSSVKEAINNAVRHGQPTQVLLKFVALENELTIQVQDNGCGFDSAAILPGNGLANLQQRMQKIGGTCEVQSAPASGTTVTFRLPL
ncbi:MAG TPA: RICIN domain-containing protein [Verrucomicrobiae bacterium]|nr:RICIN domain-containing protein [Verrucomicrobiae bacterium]